MISIKIRDRDGINWFEIGGEIEHTSGVLNGCGPKIGVVCYPSGACLFIRENERGYEFVMDRHGDWMHIDGAAIISTWVEIMCVVDMETFETEYFMTRYLSQQDDEVERVKSLLCDFTHNGMRVFVDMVDPFARAIVNRWNPRATVKIAWQDILDGDGAVYGS